ncbi:phenylalanine--tRNA ligase subunit beta [Sulfurimonas sp.]|uniref:phenylalanine--tRNA ligase subunit beta n=1 Tax=Sulfurimonas sp. TaxID=2022749 RepID=UPI0025FEE245|nr:phenylalanine--tRNA ligase subunit beta [Sulfurimonas sp.]MDD5156788.1 phenylalanine--tRNA ligase subunit beta [Sulfurimonas sp.]
MIVTKSWLNEWVDLSGITTDDLVKTLNSIGLEVDSVKTYKIPNKIIFGRVLECVKHPEADKLSVCQVDIGESTRQIVCGASNVRAGLTVVVATIGAVMPSGLVIKPVKLRGIESDGMICSASEIGLEDLQDGILELDGSIGKFKLGQEVCTNTFFNDDIIEIELTANRGDCLSIRGVARDLGAAYDRILKDKNIKENEEKRVGIGRVLTFSHENNLDVSVRYKAVDVENINLPFIIKLRLAQINEKKSTNIDSILLYATHSSGVILRAYSHEFLSVNKESMAKIELVKDNNGFVCVMAQNRASVVGVIQDEESRISVDNGVIFIEASYISPEIISRKMQEVKINSDALYYKTSRGSEPELNVGLDFCLNLIELNSSSVVYGGAIEYAKVDEDRIINVTKSEIDEIIGANIDKAKIANILKNLGFNKIKSSTDSFVVLVPKFRHDIYNKQDIAEEIVRLVGIDNIPSKAFAFTEENRLKDDYFSYKKRSIYRHKAAYSGFFESVSFVFDDKKTLKKYGFETVDESLELLNPIISTLDTLRTTLLTGLLKSASHNSKNGYSSIKLFEVGSVFNSKREESMKMAMLFSGYRESENLTNSGKPMKVDFALFAQALSDIVGSFELQQYNTAHSLSHIYQCAKVLIDGKPIGELFRLHPDVENCYDLDVTFMCELDFDKLPNELKRAKKSSKYQASFRDLSIIMPKKMSYEKVKSTIESSASSELVRFYVVDKYSDKSLGENMSLSIRFILQSFEKTLEEDDISSVMDSILESLKNKLGVGLR